MDRVSASSSPEMATGATYNVDTLLNSLRHVRNGCEWHLRKSDTHFKVSDANESHTEQMLSEMLALSTEVRQLWNSRRPVNRVPLEILKYIFELCMQFTFPLLGPYVLNGPHPLRPSIILASVCSYWRNFAISTPTLWTRCTVSHPETTAEAAISRRCLERSGSLPLTVKAQVPDSHHNDCIYIDTMTQLPRIRELWLSRIDPEGLERLSSACGYDEAPLLETLFLRAHRDVNSFSNTQLRIPWQTPQLRNVYLAHSQRWLSLPWMNLCSLCLADIQFEESKAIERMFTVLAELRHTLEDLALMKISVDRLVPTRSPGADPTIKMTVLTRIHEVDIDYNILENLIHRLILPPSCSQHIVVDDYKISWSSFVHNLDCHQPERLLVNGCEVIAVRGESALYITARKPFLDPIPRTAIVELWISSSHSYSDTWKTPWNSVKKLVLCERSSPTLTPKLSFFPRLEELHLIKSVSGSTAQTNEWLAWIGTCLRQKMELGQSIPKVVTCGPMLPSESKLWLSWAQDALAQGIPVEIDLQAHGGDRSSSVHRMEIPESCKSSPWHRFWRGSDFDSETHVSR